MNSKDNILRKSILLLENRIGSDVSSKQIPKLVFIKSVKTDVVQVEIDEASRKLIEPLEKELLDVNPGLRELRESKGNQVSGVWPTGKTNAGCFPKGTAP